MGLPQELVLALLEELPEGIAVLDARQPGLPVAFVNRAYERLSGRTRDLVVGGGVETLLRDAEDALAAGELAALLGRGETVTLRTRAEQGVGAALAEVRFQPLRDGSGEITHFVSYHHALAADHEAGTTPRLIAREDRLTGLCHADYFHEVYGRDFAIASREGRALTLFLVDIDALGIYNDTFGPQAGDSVIRRVARALFAALRRGSDLVARLGGGRFVAFATGMTAEQAHRHAETLAARVRELHVHHPRSRVARFVTVSIGVATSVPMPGTSPQSLLELATDALGAARAEGRNRVVARAATAR
jgi:diguanylate cyclase (GGDEF)-like protein